MQSIRQIITWSCFVAGTIAAAVPANHDLERRDISITIDVISDGDEVSTAPATLDDKPEIPPLCNATQCASDCKDKGFSRHTCGVTGRSCICLGKGDEPLPAKCSTPECNEDCNKQGFPHGSCAGFTGLTCVCRKALFPSNCQLDEGACVKSCQENGQKWGYCGGITAGCICGNIPKFPPPVEESLVPHEPEPESVIDTPKAAEVTVGAEKCDNSKCATSCKKQGYPYGSCGGFTGLTCVCRYTPFFETAKEEPKAVEVRVEIASCDNKKCASDCKKQGYLYGSCGGFTGLTCVCRNTPFLEMSAPEEEPTTRDTQVKIQAGPCDTKKCTADCKKQGYLYGYCGGVTGYTCFCRNTPLAGWQVEDDEDEDGAQVPMELK